MTYWVLAPEALVALGAVAALLVPALASPRLRPRLRPWLGGGAAVVALAALGLELWAGAQVGTLLAGGYVQDRFALFVKAAALLALVVLAVTADWGEETLPGALPFAFLAALGMMAAASAAGLVQLWAGLALAVVAGAAGLGRRIRGEVAAVEESLLREAAARAVLTGAGLALLAGLAFTMVAALAGSTGLDEVAAALATHAAPAAGALPALVGLGALFALMVLAPFRYGAAAPPIASPLGSGGAAAFGAGTAGVALLKLGAATVPQASGWALGLASAAALAVALAGLAAIGSGARTRTLLGLLAAAQLAWVAAGVAAHDRQGTAAAALLLGATVVALAAAPVLLGELEVGGALDLVGLAARSPGRAAGLALAALSLAGLPPLGGFVGQFLVAVALARGGYGPQLGLALLGSLLAAVGAFRLLHAAYLAAEVQEAVAGPRAARAAARRPLGAAWSAASLGALLAGLLLLAYTVFANPISGLAYQGAEALGLR